MFYDNDEGSFYTAQTTVDGRQAYVISWMQMDECCDADPDAVSYSFQLVFLNDGGGDFTAYFNYDELVEKKQGYDAVLDIDMLNGVTINSNIVTSSTVNGLTAGVCTQVDDTIYGQNDNADLTDNSWDNNANYVLLHNASERQISVWTDSGCSNPNDISELQDLDSEGYTYVGLEIVGGVDSAAVGWATFDPTDQSTDVTEFFANEDMADLVNGGSNELIVQAINTTVPGRLVLGQVGGQTTGDPNRVEPAPPVYSGPVVKATSSIAKVEPGAQISLPGFSMAQITGASIDGIAVTIISASASELIIEVPDLSAGVKNLLIIWPGGQLLHLNALEILPGVPQAEDNQKVNAGSFKGFIAVYAKGYEGSRFSAKIGEDWLIVNEIQSDFERYVEPTRWLDHAVSIRIYIDRVLIDTISLITK
jgi:hypothetical protein